MLTYLRFDINLTLICILLCIYTYSYIESLFLDSFGMAAAIAAVAV